MTRAQVVETSVTVNNNSPIQDYVHPDDQTEPFELSFSCQDKLSSTKEVLFSHSIVFWDHFFKLVRVRGLKSGPSEFLNQIIFLILLIEI